MKLLKYMASSFGGICLGVLINPAFADPSVTGNGAFPRVSSEVVQEVPSVPASVQPGHSPEAQAIFDQLAAEEKGRSPVARSSLGTMIQSSKPAIDYPEGR